ncbi:BTB/POZ domain-containing protein 6-like [Dendronephthya gigantea]|uniref:BTB/POZ domain-containing protein 6-like n=1 Tax=Dendronephthya gigantea TaxID=151771 RepID=UPI00106AFE6A|nr:BTB/POZ domain-containing protein 6-like [Dendronephthya gigantea]
MAENKSETAEAIDENLVESDLDGNKYTESTASTANEDHWQACRETIRERNRFMFKNTLMSDVHFSVGMNDDTAETQKHNLPAHKYVLAISSPVFYAMFYGSLAEVKDIIEIPDSNYESFVEFLRFLYCDEVELTIDIVLGVSYLAKKYIVPALEKKCSEFIEKSVEAGNVFKLLSFARSFKDEFVEKICWEFLDSETVEAVNSECFCQIDREVICELLKRDTLHAKEIELFLAVQKWVTQNSTDTSEPCDERLSEEGINDVVNLIRYPLMSQHEFAEHVAKSRLLRHEDVINMFLKFNDTLEDETVLPFSQVPRRGYYRCSLWEHVYDSLDIETSRMPNILTFSSNSNILLCGVGLYGSDNNDDSYTFQVYVSDEDDTMLLQSEGSFSCSSQCFAYDVIFNKPVKVHKNIWYTINATVDGPRGVYGGQSLARSTDLELGTDEINCGPVRFLFKDLKGAVGCNIYNHFSGLLYFVR